MYNYVTVMGFVGNDPELRFTQDGTPVANFNLAINNRWTSATGDEMSETIWCRVTTWRRQAETVAEYVRKGNLILVSGQIKPPYAWVDEAGAPLARLEINAQLVKFLPGNQRAGEDIEDIDDEYVGDNVTVE